MSHEWVEHIVRAKEDIRTGERSGSQEDVERELRLEAVVESVWPELCTALVAALEAFNRLVPDGELQIEGDNDDPWEGLSAARTRGVPARVDIRLARGGALHCDMSWRNTPQGRITASPEDAPDNEGLFRVGDHHEVHYSALPEHLLGVFLRCI